MLVEIQNIPNRLQGVASNKIISHMGNDT